jgi:hypothetical protein
MGLIKLFSCSNDGDDEITPPEPNPRSFLVLECERVNGNVILLVQYYGCTTFNGLKLLLIRGESFDNTFLDPHLLGGGHVVIARFEPTKEGWRLARTCANMI